MAMIDDERAQVTESQRERTESSWWTIIPSCAKGWRCDQSRSRSGGLRRSRRSAWARCTCMASSQARLLIVDISLNGPDGLDLLKNIRSLSDAAGADSFHAR